MIGPGGNWELLPRPARRTRPLLPAQPLSQYVKDCLEFLSRITAIHTTGGSKTEFRLRVEIRTRADETRMLAFEIVRSLEEIRALQYDIVEASRQHPLVSHTGLAPCDLCELFKILPPLPEFGQLLVTSVIKIHKTVEDRLNLFVSGAAVPPTNAEYHCEGQVSVPAALRDFLLRGVDDVAAFKY